MRTVNKFGYMNDDESSDSEAEEITPYHSHQYNLDDLENVEGFNKEGKKKKIYGFKLNSRNLYERAEIKIYESEIPYNIIKLKNKLKLVKNKHEWDIDIRIKNNYVNCKGDTTDVHRIFNSGEIFGNFVPKKEESISLVKHHGDYFIGCNKDKATAVLEFIPKFKKDTEILKNPPDNSVFFIRGYLLSSTENPISLIEGIDITIDLKTQKYFWIIIRKTKDNFDIKHYPEELKVSKISDDINLHMIKVAYDKYLLSRILFSKSEMNDNEIFYS